MSFHSLLKSLRKSKKIPRKRLCFGLISESMLSHIEKGERTPDKFLRDRLLGRLGVSPDGYEEYLDQDEYELWHYRKLILSGLEDRDFDQVEDSLRQYHQLVGDDDRVAKQFYHVMMAELLKNSKGSVEQIHREYENALLCTMPFDDYEQIRKVPLSVQEYNILIEFYATMLPNETWFGRYSIELLRELLRQIQSREFDAMAKAKIYPKATVMAFYEYSHSELSVANHRIMIDFFDNAIDTLRDSMRSFYLLELLETYIAILGNAMKIFPKNETEELEHKKRKVEVWYNSFLYVYTYRSKMPYMESCAYLYKETEIFRIGEVIKKRREMLGMTQKTLAEKTNCSEKTIARVENGKTSLQKDGFKKIFQRLGLASEYMKSELITDCAESIALLQEFRRAVIGRDIVLQTKTLKQLSTMVPDHPVNRQFIGLYRLQIRLLCKEIDRQQYVDEMKKNLELTIPLEMALKAHHVFLTKNELLCLYAIAIVLDAKNIMPYLKKMEEVFSHYVESGEAHLIINQAELLLSWASSKEGDLGNYDRSDAISEIVLDTCLTEKRVMYFYRCLYNTWWNLEEQKKSGKRNVQNADGLLEHCINISDFCKKDADKSFFIQKQSLRTSHITTTNHG